MSLLVGLHPSHTQMALKDPFLFSVSVNSSYFTHALNVSVASSGSCFWPQSVLWISSSILRAFATTWRIPGMGLHKVGHDWSDLAVAVANPVTFPLSRRLSFSSIYIQLPTGFLYLEVQWHLKLSGSQTALKTSSREVFSDQPLLLLFSIFFSPAEKGVLSLVLHHRLYIPLVQGLPHCYKLSPLLDCKLPDSNHSQPPSACQQISNLFMKQKTLLSASAHCLICPRCSEMPQASCNHTQLVWRPSQQRG